MDEHMRIEEHDHMRGNREAEITRDDERIIV